MQITRFRHWRIQYKIMSISIISVAVMMAGLFIYLLPLIEARIMKEKEDATRHVVEMAMGVVEYYEAAARAGTMPVEQAQKNAADQIAKLRYEKKEYVWINDLGKPVPKMIMHPILPALNGKVIDDPKFNKATAKREGLDGKSIPLDNVNLFVAFNGVCEKADHGFVNYEWAKPKEGGGSTSELYPKLSYVKLFKPWGWVLGSGIYIDDVQKQVNTVKWILVGLNLLFALFMATALSISALPVIAKTLMDLNLYRSDLGMLVVAAAVFNDLVGWIVFAVILGMLGTGPSQTLSIGQTIFLEHLDRCGALAAGLGHCGVPFRVASSAQQPAYRKSARRGKTWSVPAFGCKSYPRGKNCYQRTSRGSAPDTSR